MSNLVTLIVQQLHVFSVELPPVARWNGVRCC